MNYLVFSIILNIILLLIFYYLYKKSVSNSTCDNYPIFSKIMLSNINPISGDLLLFNNSNYNIITRTIGNPIFSHIGIIVNKNNKIYSLEMVKKDNIYPKQPRMSNVILIPLEDRLNYYSGNIFYCKLNKELNISQENKLIELSNKQIKYSYKDNCGKFIANILEELKIGNNLIPFLFWKAHNNVIKLCNGDIYGYPVELISNDRIINNINDNKLLNYC